MTKSLMGTGRRFESFQQFHGFQIRTNFAVNYAVVTIGAAGKHNWNVWNRPIARANASVYLFNRLGRGAAWFSRCNILRRIPVYSKRRIPLPLCRSFRCFRLFDIQAWV